MVKLFYQVFPVYDYERKILQYICILAKTVIFFSRKILTKEEGVLLIYKEFFNRQINFTESIDI